MSEQVVTSFKGFDKGLRCRDFQFEVGKSYEHAGQVVACAAGFHACENPLDVFGYYAPGESRYARVAQSGDLARHQDDSKIASRSIAIKAELTIPALISAAIEFVTSKCEPTKSEHATGDSSASSATGYSSASLTTGTWSSSEIKPSDDGKPQHAVAIATGDESKARAPLGSAIVLVERSDRGEIIGVFASKVGDNGIRPNVWYALRDGKPVEAQ